MYDQLQLDAHQKFLADLQSRKGTDGISLAAPYAAAAAACVGGQCERYLGGADAGASVKAAELLPTYCGDGFALESKATNSASFRNLLPEGIEPPKHTLMVLRHVLTTPREDRDKDVLKTDGASVDPAMPLLWQHMVGLPIGRRIATVDHTPEVLRLATALLDLNDLTADAAKLIEADALRFSHGFRVFEYRERKAEGRPEVTGFEVIKFEILECSLVSVPSNVDAIMEMYAKGGLDSEPMRRFAKSLADARPVVVAGVDMPDSELSSVKSACGCADKTYGESAIVNDAPPVIEKSGRVLSKRNLERLAEVRSDLQEMHDYEGMPRPCKAMCKTAMKTLDDVIVEATPSEEPDDKEVATAPVKSPSEQFADAVFSADGATLKRYRQAIDAAIEADELNHLSEEIAELFGV